MYEDDVIDLAILSLCNSDYCLVRRKSLEFSIGKKSRKNNTWLKDSVKGAL